MLKTSSTNLVAGLILACPALLGASRPYDFRKTTLDNGLTVISLEDHSCPIVAVQVWYHVGSKNEDPQRQGFAHMFEHMMFRGTDRLGPEEHVEHIRRTGGSCNAYTSFDNTTYINELPSNQLELALWLEAERMAFLRIDEEGFFTERAVVEEERRVSFLNRPYGTVREKILPVVFRKHPYRWTPIGSIPHLRAANIDELQAFWDKYYVPANATLVVVGDIRHDQVQQLARKYFGWIPKCPEPPPLNIKEPPHSEPSSVTISEKKGPVPMVGLVYRGLPMDHPDEFAFDMLIKILGDGESSRLYKDLVKQKEIAQFALAGSVALEDEGICAAGAALMPWGNKQKALQAIQGHIELLRKEGVSKRELEKARNQYLRNEVIQTLTVARKARLLGEYETLRGGAEKANDRLDQIRAVTADDLKRVANRYLTPQRQTTVIVQPEFGSMFKSLLGLGGVDEGAAPVEKPKTNRIARRGGPRAELKRPQSHPNEPPVQPLLAQIPKITDHRRKLDNGLEIVVVPNHEVPFVTMKLGIVSGAWTESKPGVASMAASMVTKGSAEHSAAEMAEELEFNAISLTSSASMDVTTVNASCVADKFDVATKLLAEVVSTPTFPPKELEVLRKQVLMGLMIQGRTPEYLADRELRQRVFGTHPYARTPTSEPEDVRSITAKDLTEWWRAFVRPEDATLYVAGDVQPEHVFRTVAGYLGAWRNDHPKPTVSVASIPPLSDTHIYLVDRPGSVQSQIRVGHIGITRTDKGYFTSRVLSQIFGGPFNSRLHKAIRTEKGLTYGARGDLSARRFAGQLEISTFTKTPSTAETLQIILREIQRIRSEQPETDEVDAAKSYLAGSFAGDRETPQAVISDLWLVKYEALPQDYFKRLLDGIKRTTPEHVLAGASRFIHEDKLTIVVVGEAAQVKADLEKIAPVTVVSPGPAGSEQAPR